MTVYREELEGSPTISFDRKGGKAKRMFAIAWNDYVEFAAEFLPSAFAAGNAGIIPPAASFPDLPWLIAESVEIEPHNPAGISGLDEDPNTYPGGAKVTVNYSTSEFDQNKDDKGDKNGPGGENGSTGGQAETFVSHRISIGGEFLILPSSSLLWEQGFTPLATAKNPTPVATYAVTEDVHAGIIVPLIEHQITWHFVPSPPWRAIRQLMGHVNAYEFAGSPIETLLFLGVEASREITSEGTKAWSLDYKFSEKNYNPNLDANPQGWNFFLRQNTGLFERLNKKLYSVNDDGSPGETLLNVAINSQKTTINVFDAATFPTNRMFRIVLSSEAHSDEEQMIVLSVSGNNWTVARGIGGTRPRSWAASDSILQIPEGIYDLGDFRFLFTNQ
jgi:hypothetical protein